MSVDLFRCPSPRSGDERGSQPSRRFDIKARPPPQLLLCRSPGQNVGLRFFRHCLFTFNPPPASQFIHHPLPNSTCFSPVARAVIIKHNHRLWTHRKPPRFAAWCTFYSCPSRPPFLESQLFYLAPPTVLGFDHVLTAFTAHLWIIEGEDKISSGPC